MCFFLVMCSVTALRAAAGLGRKGTVGACVWGFLRICGVHVSWSARRWKMASKHPFHTCSVQHCTFLWPTTVKSDVLPAHMATAGLKPASALLTCCVLISRHTVLFKAAHLHGCWLLQPDAQQPAIAVLGWPKLHLLADSLWCRVRV